MKNFTFQLWLNLHLKSSQFVYLHFEIHKLGLVSL